MASKKDLFGATVVGVVFVTWLISRNATGGGSEAVVTPERQAVATPFVDTKWRSGDQDKYELTGAKLGMDRDQVRKNATCDLDPGVRAGKDYYCNESPNSAVDSGETSFHFFNDKLIKVYRHIYWRGGDRELLWKAFASRYGVPSQNGYGGMYWGERNKNGDVKRPYLAIDYVEGTAILQDPDAVALEQAETDRASREAREREQRAKEDAVAHMR